MGGHLLAGWTYEAAFRGRRELLEEGFQREEEGLDRAGLR